MLLRRRLVILLSCLILVVVSEFDNTAVQVDFIRCVDGPLCENRSASLQNRIWCRFSEPMSQDSKQYHDYVLNRMKILLDAFLIGQDHLVPQIVADVTRKLRKPNEPLIMHFAGDNGVGKTSAAHLISASMSFRCHPSNVGPTCLMGDNMLSLSGTNYHGVEVSEFRRIVVNAVLQHAKRFPFGVIVLNDVTSLDPRLVPVLFPLFGRGTHFPEDASVDLRKLTVILTTDFGVEGRTNGKSLNDVKLIIEDEVRRGFGGLAGSLMSTYAFLPATIASAKRMVQLGFGEWACHAGALSMGVEEQLITALIDLCVDRIAFENGRAVSLMMEGVLGALQWNESVIRDAHVKVQRLPMAHQNAIPLLEVVPV